jgi:hypothetical protein
MRGITRASEKKRERSLDTKVTPQKKKKGNARHHKSKLEEHVEKARYLGAGKPSHTLLAYGRIC